MGANSSRNDRELQSLGTAFAGWDEGRISAPDLTCAWSHLPLRVLGIESSCDETGVAIYDDGSPLGITANLLHSQVDMHREYGGVVPELASRDHIRKTLPLVDDAMRQAGLKPAGLDAVAYTAGPGLVGALLVGASVAKGLALAWGLPSLGVHHMEGHLLAVQLADEPPSYPFVALLVSGGHTQLMACQEPGRYQLLGESLDDAAGEAFDKVAKMLGLPYPGGPAVAALAEKGNKGKKGEDGRFSFPRPMTGKPGLDFSFSGLKTYTLNTLAELGEASQQDKADIAAAFQEAVVDTLRIKCERAMKATGFKTLVIAGGVSANLALRSRLGKLAQEAGFQVYYPPLQLCTDNGAMIAYAGYVRLKMGHKEGLAIAVRPRWPLAELEG